MARTHKTHEQFIKDFSKKYGCKDYIFLDKYKKHDIEMRVKHTVCGEVNIRTPRNFLQSKYACLFCSGKRKSTKMFKNEIYNLVGNEYTVLGTYKNTHSKINLKHNICNYSYEVTPASFLSSGTRCPKCSGRIKGSTKIFKEEVFKAENYRYEVVGEYRDIDTKIKMRHTKCGYEYETTPYLFLNNRGRCPLCNPYYKKNTEIFKKQIYDLEKDNYILLSEYINDATHVTIKHNECGHIYQVTPSNFLRGKRCPSCIQSKGETKIRKWLEENMVDYMPQYTLDDCKYKRPPTF